MFAGGVKEQRSNFFPVERADLGPGNWLEKRGCAELS